MRKICARTLLLVAAASLAGTLLPAMASGQEEHGEAHFHRNALGVFVGASTLTKFRDDPTDLTLGVEYFRRLTDRASVGLIVEYVDGDLERDWVALVPVAFHPFDGWARNLVFAVGPGIEFASLSEEAVEELEGGEGEEDGAGHAAGEEGHVGDRENETEAVVRLGVSYVLRLGRFDIVPQVNADVIGDNVTWVTGIALGIGF